MPPDAWERALKLLEESGGLLVVGTSGVVMPAGLLPIIAARAGKPVVEVNIEETAVTPYATIHLRGRAGEVLPRLLEEARRLLREATH